MAEQRLLKGKYKDKDGEYEEKFMCDYDPDAEKTYKETLKFFNSDLHEWETERFFISAEWIDNEKEFYCDFQKSNAGTLKDGIGYYDRVVCIHCGKVRRRRRIDSSDIKKIICKKLKKEGL